MTMNRKMYELTYILTSVLTSEQTAEVVVRVNEIIESAGGSISEVEEWGARKLAYPVDKKKNGYYVNLYFEGPGTLIPRIERALTIDDNVLRSLILAMDKSMVAHFHTRTAGRQEVGENQANAETTTTGSPRKYIDYKDTDYLRRFVNEQGKMLPRRVLDVPAKKQRAISRAIKRARHLALMPYVADSVR